MIELVDAKKVTATMQSLGAHRMKVLRGVEDQKAYDQGTEQLAELSKTIYDYMMDKMVDN